uniref:GH16 domain-containing protein n=1 Tax=Leersia perrieri TaxID=77586 RepID=A0A0D9XMW4_9ORYZ
MAITSSWSGPQQLVIISSAVLMMMSSWAAAAVDLSPAAFDVAYTPLFGGDNLVRSPDGRTVHLKLDRFTGSGFVSKSAYHHGFFSASIKLPDDYTAGVVVAFYLSNGDVEARRAGLGAAGHVYGNGSTSRGREERYLLPLDPTAAFHSYAIAWSPAAVLFYIDGAPIHRRLPGQAHVRGTARPGRPTAAGTRWTTPTRPATTWIGFECGLTSP